MPWMFVKFKALIVVTPISIHRTIRVTMVFHINRKKPFSPLVFATIIASQVKCTLLKASLRTPAVRPPEQKPHVPKKQRNFQSYVRRKRTFWDILHGNSCMKHQLRLRVHGIAIASQCDCTY